MMSLPFREYALGTAFRVNSGAHFILVPPWLNSLYQSSVRWAVTDIVRMENKHKGGHTHRNLWNRALPSNRPLAFHWLIEKWWDGIPGTMERKDRREERKHREQRQRSVMVTACRARPFGFQAGTHTYIYIYIDLDKLLHRLSCAKWKYANTYFIESFWGSNKLI